jgi:hypothetical protein
MADREHGMAASLDVWIARWNDPDRVGRPERVADHQA